LLASSASPAKRTVAPSSPVAVIVPSRVRRSACARPSSSSPPCRRRRARPPWRCRRGQVAGHDMVAQHRDHRRRAARASAASRPSRRGCRTPRPAGQQRVGGGAVEHLREPGVLERRETADRSSACDTSAASVSSLGLAAALLAGAVARAGGEQQRAASAEQRRARVSRPHHRSPSRREHSIAAAIRRSSGSTW
jgi:hypothetical protein